MKNQRKAYLYALSAIACWSTIGSAFKLSLQHLTPAGLLFYSSLVAVSVLFAILVVRGDLKLLALTTRRQAAHSALLGLLNPFLYYTVLLQAYDLLKAQEAGTLNYIWPLVLVLLSIPMLKQRITAGSILAIFISFAGIVLISFHPGTEDPAAAGSSRPLGIMLAVGSALFWALYWILNIRDPREEVRKLFLNFCFGSLYSGIYLVATEPAGIPSWQGLAGSTYLGVFEMGLTFVLWLNALKYSVTTAKVSNLIYLSPFISLILIHFSLGEHILPTTVAGLALIVAGIGMQQYLRR